MTVASVSCSKCWGTYPTFTPGSRWTAPPVTDSLPRRTRRMVVLPDPLAPIRPSFCPELISKEAPVSTG